MRFPVIPLLLLPALVWIAPAPAGFEDTPKQLVDEVWQTVNTYFVDDKKDWLKVRETYLARDYATPEAAYTAIRQMLKGLNDPYTRFMEPKQYTNSRVSVAGEYGGVGITVMAPTNQEPKIVAVTPGSPAAKAGLQIEDIVQAVDGTPTREQASTQIRGQIGTQVTLTVRRAEQTFDVTLTREAITIATVRSSWRKAQGQTVGYLSLRDFNGNAPQQLRQAVQGLLDRGVDGFLLDLRDNPGGLVESSRLIASIFLDREIVVSTVNRKGIRRELRASGNRLTAKPLVLLVNEGSASASEILAGALQDHQRATLVGTKTFGKGLVQAVYELSDRSGLAVTIQHYKTPAGRDIHRQGLQPDYAVTTAPKTIDRATSRDPQYVRATAVLLKQVSTLGER
ncbi:S41 family peptidase [Candidatus Cyanaurora vandensis]|uniref:S41 family peptidase n=1 Tax=Candidatus Cyanaurora vandensis TaxID=2714958 RepID=UPI00257D46A3|nr:S41 family peptidase [Candidatus Cyanaurora vandensis]